MIANQMWEAKGPITSWDEALPLGNGLLGLLIWKGDGVIQISMDRADLWDTRTPAPFKRKDWNWPHLLGLVRAKDWTGVSSRFGEVSGQFPYPTKLPAGRIVFRLPTAKSVDRSILDRSSAIGRVSWPGGALEAFCGSTTDVICLRYRGNDLDWHIEAPAFAATNGRRKHVPTDPAALGYAGAEHWSAGDGCGFTQSTTRNGAFSVAILRQKTAAWTELYLTIQPGKEADTARKNALTIVEAARLLGWRRLVREHRAEWTKFWQQSSVTLPDKVLGDLYQQASYLLGSASRRGGPPISLQAVWTADDGQLPPWRGDYHHNINTQMTYWPHLTAGHADLMKGFLDHMRSVADRHRKLARYFFGVPGLFIPGAMALDGQLIGGYAQVSYSLTNGAWVAYMFYQYWKYTCDEQFLREEGYPYCAEVAEFLAAMLAEDDTGDLALPISASPEIHEGGPDGWVPPTSHYDLSLMRWLFGALAEMAEALGLSNRKWLDLLAKLPPLAVSAMTEDEVPHQGAGAFLIAPGKPLHQSHRHHSHLMSIYPLGLSRLEVDQAVIEQSLRQIDRLGTGLWTGFSFPWIACIAARAGQGERARQALKHFAESFVSPNGFHLNGDYRKRGISWWNYRPFTIEADFGYLEAVHEILLQSWGGVLRIFPAAPEEWTEVSFTNLRAEGASTVSAKRVEGRTREISVVAKRSATITIADPFDGKGKWNQPLESTEEGYLRFHLHPNQTLHGHR